MSSAPLPTPVLGSRALFSSLEARAYLNHAGISPPSDAVRSAIAGYFEVCARRGSLAIGTWIEQRARLREKLALLLGASAEQVAFVPNTSLGVSHIALSHPWNPGEVILTFEGEFPANVTPWQSAAGLFGLELRQLPRFEGEPTLEANLSRLEAELARGKVSLVALSLVQFQTGLRNPVEKVAALCREHGVALFVDAVQALGVMPVDVAALGADYLTSGSHKWVMGPEGTGVLWVHPARLGALRPATAGWLSHEDPVSFLLRGAGLLRYDRPMRGRADFLEGGTPNASGLVGLEAAVDTLLHLGASPIFEHVQTYLDALEPALLERGFRSERASSAWRSGILAVEPPRGVDLVSLHAGLGRRGVPCAMPDGRLRFSPHWSSPLGELTEVLPLLDLSLAESR